MTFTETKTFAPWALWLMRICILGFALVFFFLYAQGIFKSLWVPLLIVVISAPLFLLLEFAKLKTRIGQKGISLRTVYNTQGQEGVLLTFKTSKKVVIGTQRKAALQKALDTYFKS